MENDYYQYRFYKHLLNVEATEDGGILFQMDTSYQNLPLLLDVPIVTASEVNLLPEPPAGTAGQQRSHHGQRQQQAQYFLHGQTSPQQITAPWDPRSPRVARWDQKRSHWQ